MLTFEFTEVQMGFPNGEVGLERCDLFPQNKEMFDKKELPIQGALLQV